MSITINTPEGLEFFSWLQLQGRLRIEVNTGMKFRQSTLKLVNYKFGTNFRRKQQALDFMDDIIEQVQPTRDPADSLPVTDTP